MWLRVAILLRNMLPMPILTLDLIHTDNNVKKSVTTLLAGILFTTTAAPAVVTDVTPGELKAILTAENMAESSLVVSGVIDVRDLLTISSMPNLKELDLSDAHITAYNIDRPIELPEGNYPDNYLPESMFFSHGLIDIQLPVDLKTIGAYALAGNDFTNIILPEGLEVIDEMAFYGCQKLTSIVVPMSVNEIGAYSFAECPVLTEVDLSSTSISSIPEHLCFNDAALKDLKLPATLREICGNSFAGCSMLSSMEYPSGLQFIGDNAFAMSGLASVSLPSSVIRVEDFAFQRCDNLTNADLSNAFLGTGVFFYNDSLSDVTGETIVRIPPYTFAGDTKLQLAASDRFIDTASIGEYGLLDNKAVTNIILGGWLERLDRGAFEGMTSLQGIDVTALGSYIPETGSNIFAGINQPTVRLIVAEGTRDIWQAAPQWREFTIEELTGIDDIAEGCGIIKAWFRDKILHIEAPRLIVSVEVYTSSGIKVYQAAPNAESINVSTSDFDDTIYLVRINTQVDSATIKLMR